MTCMIYRSCYRVGAPVQHLLAAGSTVDGLDHDLSKVCDLDQIQRPCLAPQLKSPVSDIYIHIFGMKVANPTVARLVAVDRLL